MNVIAPIAAPSDISIKLAILIFPVEPKLNTSGFKKAEIATKILLQDQLNYKNQRPSSGIAVIGILNAIKAPIDPPANKNMIKYKKPVEKLPTDIIVTPIAITIPIIPYKFPCLEVLGMTNLLKPI